MKITFLAALLFLVGGLWSQSSETLNSDRPGQTFSANTVGKNVFQVQSGFGYDNLWYRNAAYISSEFTAQKSDVRFWSAYNVTDLRYGLLEPFEVGLTLISSYNDVDGEEILLGNTMAAENAYDAYLSLRYNLINTNKWTVGLYGSGLMSFKELNLRAMGSYQVNASSSLNSNIAYRTTSVNGRSNQISYTLNFSQGFDQWGVFAETFANIRLHGGDFHHSDWQNYFDAGLWYLVNNNLQLDFSVGTGFNDQFIFTSIEETSRLFFDLGLSYRIK